MKDVLWMLFVIIQYLRATLLLLTVITRKKQAFWNSNEMQRASFTGLTPLLLAIYQILCQWESNSARWSHIHWPCCTPCWFSARFEDRLLNIHSQPRLVVGLITVAWNSLEGGKVSLATGETLKAPGPGPCCNSISIFIKKVLSKALLLALIFVLLGYFHSSGLLAVFSNTQTASVFPSTTCTGFSGDK